MTRHKPTIPTPPYGRHSQSSEKEAAAKRIDPEFHNRPSIILVVLTKHATLGSDLPSAFFRLFRPLSIIPCSLLLVASAINQSIAVYRMGSMRLRWFFSSFLLVSVCLTSSAVAQNAPRIT